ncbi:MAG: GSH-dependent disulfide-bond oxidoreductase [Betaproteobacteria bacterium]|jgi:GST-like protein|nr:GSH-dependent disulfide-bond oxidoreductase [Betaproteobacteria bacterium]
MIDLYAAGTSNGMRARIALEECGLQYNWHPIDLMKGENRAPQFLALNPMGQIPVMVDNEGPGGKKITMAQSSAIMMYCAEKAGKFIPKDPAKRAAMLEAYMSASTDITPMFGAVNTVVRSKEPHEPTAKMFKERLRGYFTVWNDLLAKRKYAAGDELTIADLSLYAGYWRTKGAQPDVVQGFANMERWAAEMAARPGIQKATKL